MFSEKMENIRAPMEPFILNLFNLIVLFYEKGRKKDWHSPASVFVCKLLAPDSSCSSFSDLAYGRMPSHMQQQLAADQQERKLTGVVYGSDGETLPGAHVYVKGNIQCAVVTDLDGKFTLKVPANAKALVASFVGFETAEIPITKKTNYVITLNSGSEIEEVEVVATGYQLFKKNSFTGNATVVTKD